MTSHFSPQDFVDALDGALTPAQQTHLASCETCRRDVADGQSLLAATRPVGEVPEPSPLFWPHFSARVAAAVSATPVPQPFWAVWWRPVGALATVAGAVLLAVLLKPATTGVDPVADPAPVAVTASADVDGLPAAEPEARAGDDGFAEATLALVSAVAGDLSWEEAHAANLAPRQAMRRTAVQELTPAQQRELIRLVQQEIGGSEAPR